MRRQRSADATRKEESTVAAAAATPTPELALISAASFATYFFARVAARGQMLLRFTVGGKSYKLEGF